MHAWEHQGASRAWTFRVRSRIGGRRERDYSVMNISGQGCLRLGTRVEESERQR